jgi:hypothetical protein
MIGQDDFPVLALLIAHPLHPSHFDIDFAAGFLNKENSTNPIARITMVIEIIFCIMDQLLK